MNNNKIVKITTIDIGNDFNNKSISPREVIMDPIQPLSVYIPEISDDISDDDFYINEVTKVLIEDVSKLYISSSHNSNCDWKDELLPYLELNYYNSTSEDFNTTEIIEKDKCKYHLYVVTPYDNNFENLYLNVIDSIIKKKSIIYCLISELDGKTFDNDIFDKLDKLGRKINENFDKYFTSLNDTIKYLNSCY